MNTTLSSYACHAAHSRGRLHPEGESKTRTPFQRDRDRILHAGESRDVYQHRVVLLELATMPPNSGCQNKGLDSLSKRGRDRMLTAEPYIVVVLVLGGNPT